MKKFGMGISCDVTGTIEERDGRLAFVFDRATDWGGVVVSYAHLDNKKHSDFKIGQRVIGTIAPDLDRQEIVIQSLHLRRN